MTKVVKVAVAGVVTIGAWVLACVPTKKKVKKMASIPDETLRVAEETLETAAKLHQEIQEMDKAMDETIQQAEDTLENAIHLQAAVKADKKNKEEK